MWENLSYRGKEELMENTHFEYIKGISLTGDPPSPYTRGSSDMGTACIIGSSLFLRRPGKRRRKRDFESMVVRVGERELVGANRARHKRSTRHVADSMEIKPRLGSAGRP